MARKNKVKLDQLAPKIAAGYTDRPMTPEEARREFPVQPRPAPKLSGAFMLLEPGTAEIQEPNTGRKFLDVDVTMDAEKVGQIREGYRCLRCKEGPFDESFPLTCDVCGYEIRARQAVDFRMEFEGEKHIGPAKPLSAFMDEVEMRQEQALFRQKIQGGRSPMKGLH
jgi:hypothetical protein